MWTLRLDAALDPINDVELINSVIQCATSTSATLRYLRLGNFFHTLGWMVLDTRHEDGQNIDYRQCLRHSEGINENSWGRRGGSLLEHRGALSLDSNPFTAGG